MTHEATPKSWNTFFRNPQKTEKLETQRFSEKKKKHTLWWTNIAMENGYL